MKTIRWCMIAPPGGRYHVARGVYASGTPYSPHTHDFAEAFWVEQGPGLHWINGERLRLDPGDLVLVRSGDHHTFSARGGRPLTLVNVAFPPEHLHAMQHRYGAELKPWPWQGEGALPTRWRLLPDQMAELSRWAAGASMTNQTAMELDWFLMLLMRAGRPGVSAGRARWGSHCPEWLCEALERFATPNEMAGGVAGLAQLAQRSPEHVNRVIRRCLKKKAGQVVNDLRMEYAARELRMTNRPILEIAADTGLVNVGYFYLSFRQHFGLPPKRYRVREQKLMR